jgi:hypothetical protein
MIAGHKTAITMTLERAANRKISDDPHIKGIPKGVLFNSISSWFKSCITLAHQLSGEEVSGSVKCHSVRSMAASRTNLRNVGINAVREACFWKSKNTFATYFLKDLTEVEDKMCRLGKLSVSSSIV